MGPNKLVFHAKDKHPSLFGPSVSYEDDEVMWMQQLQGPGLLFINAVSYQARGFVTVFHF
jgi:hypothetical protein